jgi:hypothetical protein
VLFFSIYFCVSLIIPLNLNFIYYLLLTVNKDFRLFVFSLYIMSFSIVIMLAVPRETLHISKEPGVITIFIVHFLITDLIL